MTLKKRIIPIIYYAGTNQVQSISFIRPHRVIGDLVSAVKVMERRKVDELIIIDVDASKNNTPPNFDLVEKLANEVYCPFTVGGGIRNYDDVRELLLCGADKVCIQKLAYNSPLVFTNIINKVGAQSVVMSVDFDENCDLNSCIKLINFLSPGEVLLTSKRYNGTMQGYDIDSTRHISRSVAMPVIANGGAGMPHHIVTALSDGDWGGNAHAAAASTMWQFTDWTPRSIAREVAKNNIEVRI